jgi:hypothetical protein
MVIDSLRRCNIRIRTPSEAKGGKLNPNYGKIATEGAKQKLSDSRKGENNPFYGKLHTERTRRKWSEARRGENNPSWQGGVSFEPYCKNFNVKFKEYIREKFNRRCFLCDKTEEENGRRLDVHHVNYNKNCLCDDVDCQFVPLCQKCHAKTNRNREYWEREITTKLHEKINGWYV